MQAHLPQRPSWLCGSCGQPWPCPSSRQLLLREYTGNSLALSVYLGAQLLAAIEDFRTHHPRQPANLYDRFMSWRPD
jgi:hypothetical protein